MRPASNKVEKNVLHRESPGPHTGARRAILFVSTRNALRHRRVLGNGIRCGQHGVLISSRLVGRVRTDQDPASVERVCRVFGPRCGVRNDHFDGLRAVRGNTYQLEVHETARVGQLSRRVQGNHVDGHSSRAVSPWPGLAAMCV